MECNGSRSMKSNGPQASIRIGISSCLLGERVRYDGGHKRDDYLVEALGPFVEWVPVCPEVEVGMGTPRETVQLALSGDTVRMRSGSGVDYTERMDRFAMDRVQALQKDELNGYVLKSGSPSCGMKQVPVAQSDGKLLRNGRGLFAKRLIESMPHLPVEEEGRLRDTRIRERFLTRAYAHFHWMTGVAQRLSAVSLQDYHRKYKYLLMAHSQTGLRRLGRILAEPALFPSIEKQAEAYSDGFAVVMEHPATRKNHTNALHHLAGYVSGCLSATNREELTSLIRRYRAGNLPLTVLIEILRHCAWAYDITYLKDQAYLYPFPAELMMFNPQ